MASVKFPDPLPSTWTSKRSPQEWLHAIDDYLAGWQFPRVFFPVQVSPDLLFKTAADIKDFLGLEEIPPTVKSRETTVDFSTEPSTRVANRPEVSYCMLEDKDFHRLRSRVDIEDALRCVMIDGNSRRMFSPTSEKKED